MQGRLVALVADVTGFSYVITVEHITAPPRRNKESIKEIKMRRHSTVESLSKEQNLYSFYWMRQINAFFPPNLLNLLPQSEQVALIFINTI